jgi:hypothetical protein
MGSKIGKTTDADFQANCEPKPANPQGLRINTVIREFATNQQVCRGFGCGGIDSNFSETFQEIGKILPPAKELFGLTRFLSKLETDKYLCGSISAGIT